MAEHTGSGPDVQGWLAGFHGHGEAAEGRVRVDASGTGEIEDVQLDPKAMRLASEDLAEAFKQAFAAAREDVRQQMSESAPPFQVASGDINATLDDLQHTAERRLSEFSEMAEQLSARIDRML